MSCEVGVTIAELEQWRELALAGIEAGLKSRQNDPLEARLKEAVHRVGELTMEVSKCCAWSASGGSAAL
ncbi:MAG: hypothetical protein VB137_07685 [Burkholderia sp.]